MSRSTPSSKARIRSQEKTACRPAAGRTRRTERSTITAPQGAGSHRTEVWNESGKKYGREGNKDDIRYEQWQALREVASHFVTRSRSSLGTRPTPPSGLPLELTRGKGRSSSRRAPRRHPPPSTPSAPHPSFLEAREGYPPRRTMSFAAPRRSWEGASREKGSEGSSVEGRLQPLPVLRPLLHLLPLQLEDADHSPLFF